MTTKPDPDGLIEEQLAFYRADASAYEAWETEVFSRSGGGAMGEALRAERRRLLAQVRGRSPRGQVLELAAGTGTYTEALLESAAEVTAVDASPESLAILRRKLARHTARLRILQADLFSWQPERRYDGVFFAFWLSHVPPRRFDAFWELVQAALAPGGRVCFLDSAGPSSARDPAGAPTKEVVAPGSTYREWDCHEDEVSVREVGGRRYRVVKVAWPPAELEERLAALGWRASVARSAVSIWGFATRAD